MVLVTKPAALYSNIERYLYGQLLIRIEIFDIVVHSRNRRLLIFFFRIE